MGWKDSQFDRADIADEVQWVFFYWRTVKCNDGCKGDYRLEQGQFDHIPASGTREEALERLKAYAENRREGGDTPGLKNHSLFLAKVDTVIHITDENGTLIND